MSQENIEVVRRAVAAVNERDVNRYLALCTDDIQLETPWTAVEGVYEGRDAIRRFFTDLNDTAPDFHLEIERLDSIGSYRVLGFLRVRASGRATGITAGPESLSTDPPEAGIPTANVYDFSKGRIRRIRVFVNRAEALEAVGLRQ
jgi:ketosteroid isomerase-like protein